MERPWWKRPCADAEREDEAHRRPDQAPAKAQRKHTMTGSDDSHSSTRPISVAELLARNGTIGAPPVGGRRRRRRGDTDSISVAELTGEIPIVRDHDIADHEVEEPEASAPPSVLADEHDESDEPISPVTTNGVIDNQDAET